MDNMPSNGQKRLKDRLLNQAGREYKPRQRFIALFLEAIFFLIVLPFALMALGSTIDRWLGFPAILLELLNLLIGWLLIIGGWFFAIWSIYTQFTIGRGTPVPLMATQKLVIEPPYSYCRNPMALGAIFMYLGVAVRIGSIGAILLVFFGAVLLLTYIKIIEEKEMEIRFGVEYLTYKRETPFLIPRFKHKKHKGAYQ